MKIKWNQFIFLIICSTILATIIIPAQTPVYAATKSGNTSGNLENSAYAVVSGEWIYYAVNNCIYKIKTDGTGLTIVMNKQNNGISGLNVVGNWIYYVKTAYKNGEIYNRLYKININGKGNKCLSTDQISPYGTVTVYNGWIYYSCNDYIYKIKTDGTQKTKLVQLELLDSFSISGEWIYYIDSYKGICKVKTNGKSNKCIKKTKDLQSCQISNGWIYYKTSSNTVYKIKTNGTKNKKITSNVLAYNVNNGWIYYSRIDKGFYKTKINGTSKKKISKMDPSVINILGDSIYFINIVDHIFYHYKMKTDGKQLQNGWY